MDYNRVVKDLNGYNTEEFMQEIRKKFDLRLTQAKALTTPKHCTPLGCIWTGNGSR